MYIDVFALFGVDREGTRLCSQELKLGEFGFTRSHSHASRTHADDRSADNRSEQSRSL